MRGRRRQPDQLKAMKGNPSRERLMFASASSNAAPPTPVPMPEFLTHPREQTIFRRVVDDYLQKRVARAADVMAYGRWATYMHRWMTYKEQLDGKSTFYKITSNHGERLARLPVFNDMLAMESAIGALEDKLGLNPVARQNIIRGLSQISQSLGGLSLEEAQHAENDTPEQQAKQEEERPPSPIGIGRLN